MGLRFSNQIFGQCFFVTTTFKEWEKFGKINGFYVELAKSLNFCSEKYKAKIIGFVFMPSHIHLLLVLDGNKLSGFMRDFKKFIAQKVAKDLGLENLNIWMPRYDKVIVYTENVFCTKLNYIHNNPVKSGLVEKSEDWVWSSASNYLGQENGVINVWKDWMF